MVFSLDPTEPWTSRPVRSLQHGIGLPSEAGGGSRTPAPRWSTARRKDWIPSGDVKIAMENHNFLWENPLFLWSFSIAMLVITRGYIGYCWWGIASHWILLVGYRIYMWTMVNINNHFLNGVTLHWIKLWQLKGTSASVTEMQQRHGEHSPLMVGSGRHFSGVSRCRCTAPPQNIVSTEEHTTPGLSSFTAKFVTWDSDFYHLLN